MLNMVASITGALSNVRAATSETRRALSFIIYKLEKESIEALIHIEDVSKNQSVVLADGTESISDVMQHVESQ